MKQSNKTKSESPRLAREELGDILRAKMKALSTFEQQRTIYRIEKLSRLPGHQIKHVLFGDANYTFDTLYKVLRAVNCRIFIGDLESDEVVSGNLKSDFEKKVEKLLKKEKKSD